MSLFTGYILYLTLLFLEPDNEFHVPGQFENVYVRAIIIGILAPNFNHL